MVSYAHTYRSNFFARLVRWKMQWNAGIPHMKTKMRKASTFSLSIAFLLRSSRNSQHNLDDIQAIDWSKDFSENHQGGLLKENKIVKKRNKRAKLSFKLWKFHNRPESRTRTSAWMVYLLDMAAYPCLLVHVHTILAFMSRGNIYTVSFAGRKPPPHGWKNDITLRTHSYLCQLRKFQDASPRKSTR